MSGGLRKRFAGYFVQVPRETVRDRRLGFKERGILAYLLDMPEGYNPSIEKLAGASDGDSKHAVGTGLQKLREYGYYRVERRRLMDGTFTMGSAVSPTAVPEWARDHAEHDGGPVPLVEQVNGSFKVIRPDGSLVDDGFEDPPEDPEAEVRARAAHASPQVRPEPGFPDPDSPDTVSPDTARPDPENPAPKDKQPKPEDEELSEDSLRSSSDTSGACGDACLPGLGRPAPPAPPAAPSFEDFYAKYPKRVARGEARKAWDQMTKRGAPPDAILAGVDVLLANLPDNKKWIKNPATWLRAECWLDDAEALRAAKASTSGSNLYLNPDSTAGDDFARAMGG